MQRTLIVLFAGGAMFAAPCVAAAPGGDVSETATIAKCEGCHGPGGNSTSRSVPRLNGQNAAYIASRLKAFLDPASQTPGATHAMWDISNQIRPEEIDKIAQYFSGQTPTAAGETGKTTVAGRRIYMDGVGTAIPACRSCHGAQGQGSGVTPRLAGQHADYLSFQLQSFNLRTRYHSGMANNTKAMSLDQIEAVSKFLGRD